MGSLCTRQHEGAHRLLWNDDRDVPMREVVYQATVHAPEATDADLDVVMSIVRRARLTHRTPMVIVREDEYETLRAVVEDAAEYMTANGYAEDTDSPEIAAQARALGDGRIALVCWTGQL